MNKILKKFWNINLIDNDNADVLIYDEIAMKTSQDFWTGAEGTEVTPKAFRDDLEGIMANNICVRINSGGGDVFAAESIATAIKDERAKGKTANLWRYRALNGGFYIFKHEYIYVFQKV